MLIWGGHAFNGQLNSGAAYDPGADSWSSIQSFGAPTSRLSHVAVWTGEEMIIWGGASPIDTKTGGRYDPLTDSWTPTSTLDAPAGRRDAAVVWTGTEMIVWGGTRFDPQTSSLVSVGTGGRYDPMDDQWLPLTDVGAPAPRSNHTVVWTGSRMIVWGAPTTAFPSGWGPAMTR
jgi:N-acetylneuraminic acid mutarotase